MRLVVVLCAGLLSYQSVALAQAPEGASHVLALPVSVGSVAMLVRHAVDPEVQKRLAAALRHEDPDVRTVAARVVLVTASRNLLDDVSLQLDRETDSVAAVEQLRTIATFSTATSDAALVAHAIRLGPDAASVLADVLGRIRPGSAAAFAPRLATVSESAWVVNALIGASVREPALAPSMALASLAAGPSTWAGFLNGRHARNLPVDGASLRAGLRAEQYDTRLQTLRYVAMVAAHEGDAIDPDVVRSIADGAETPATPETWESALAELVRRAVGRKARTIDWEPLIEKQPEQSRALFSDINGSLLGRERGRVEKMLGYALGGNEFYKSQGTRVRKESWQELTRTAHPFVGGLFGDLMRLTACEPDNRAVAAAEVAYRGDGRPRAITPAELPLTDGCRETAAVVFSLMVAPPRYVDGPGASDGLVLPLSSRFMACTAERPPTLRSPLRERGVVTPPKVKALPAARYPDRVRQQGIRGVVVVTVELSSTGCVRSVETDRSLHPALDLEAIQAALMAAIDPMHIDGQPVATRLSVAIWFGR